MRLKILFVSYIIIGSFFCGVLVAGVIPPKSKPSWWEPLIVFVIVVLIAATHLWESRAEREGERT